MKIKLAKDLAYGDIIVHDTEKYQVTEYKQCLGMGNFYWGEYGYLYFERIQNPYLTYYGPIFPKWWQFWKDKPEWKSEDHGYIITYRDYPFIVLEEKSGESPKEMSP